MKNGKRTIWTAYGWLSVVTILLLPLLPVTGAVDIFLKIDGIDGESNDSIHSDEIDVLSWSWEVSNSGTTHVAGSAGNGEPSFEDLSVTKYIDKSSAPLLLHAASGRRISEAELVVRKAGGTPLEFLKLEMKNIIVTKISTGGTVAEDRPTEKVNFNFAAFRLTYVEQNADGSGGSSNVTEWNIPDGNEDF